MSLITDNTSPVSIGDFVAVRAKPNGAHAVTAIEMGYVQVDGGRWYKFDEVMAVADTPLPQGDGARKSKTSGEYIALLKSLEYKFELSELDDRVYVNNEPLTDVTEAIIRTQMRDLGEFYVNQIRDAYITHSADNAFHPIKRYLESLQYDGGEHIDRLGMHFTDEDNIFPFFLKRWIVGCVAKVYEQAQNPMLVLDGGQDLGKSFFARWLCSPVADFFVEGPITPDDKDAQMRLINKFLWEVAELGSTTRKADRESLKYFLTMEKVVVRVPYGRNDIIKPALASFIGTVNNEGGILNDPTGSRRFLVTHITAIDWKYSKEIDVNQVWAEAFHLYASGADWRLETGERALSGEINDRYQVEDPLLDMLTTNYEIDTAHQDWVMPTNTILEMLHTRAWRLSTPRAEAMAVSTEMKKLGLSTGRITDPLTGQQVRGYHGVRARPSSY